MQEISALLSIIHICTVFLFLPPPEDTGRRIIEKNLAKINLHYILNINSILQSFVPIIPKRKSTPYLSGWTKQTSESY